MEPQFVSPRMASITNREYQELLHRIARQNQIIDSIRSQVNICKDAVPKNTLQKLLCEV